MGNELNPMSSFSEYDYDHYLCCVHKSRPDATRKMADFEAPLSLFSESNDDGKQVYVRTARAGVPRRRMRDGRKMADFEAPLSSFSESNDDGKQVYVHRAHPGVLRMRDGRKMTDFEAPLSSFSESNDDGQQMYTHTARAGVPRRRMRDGRKMASIEARALQSKDQLHRLTFKKRQFETSEDVDHERANLKVLDMNNDSGLINTDKTGSIAAMSGHIQELCFGDLHQTTILSRSSEESEWNAKTNSHHGYIGSSSPASETELSAMPEQIYTYRPFIAGSAV